MDKDLLAAISLWSADLDLPDGLLHAIVLVESGGEICAMRYEPHYRWLYRPEAVKPHSSSLSTEREMQKFSYGPCQVMGGLAREMGHRGWLVELCGPLGVEYGAKYLAKQSRRYNGDWLKAIAAYNAGSARPGKDGARFVNQRYVDKVVSRWAPPND